MPNTTHSIQPTTARWLVLGGIVGPLWFTVAYHIAGIIREGYSSIQQPISDLGIGSNAWLLNLPLIALGGFFAFFALGFYRLAPDFANKKRWSLALALFGILFCCAGVFPESDPAGPLTLTGFLHFALGMYLGMPLLVTTLFKIGSRLRKLPAWRQFGRYTILTARLMILCFPLMSLTFAPGLTAVPPRAGWTRGAHLLWHFHAVVRGHKHTAGAPGK